MTSPDSPTTQPQMIPLEGASGYFLTNLNTTGVRIFSVRSKKMLSRHRYGTRWRTQIVLDDGRAQWVYLDDPHGKGDGPSLEDVLEQGAVPLEGFPDFMITPEPAIYRVTPAKRGLSARGINRVQEHLRSGSPYVQLPCANGRRSTLSLLKLKKKAFGPDVRSESL